MKKVFYLLTALSVWAMLACNKYDLPADLVLKIDETITADGLRIQLTDIEESRCAEGVTCVWAGEAKVYLRLDAQETVVLTARGLCAGEEACRDTAIYKQYRIILEEVTPYPKANVEIKKADYRVKLSVDRQ